MEHGNRIYRLMVPQHIAMSKVGINLQNGFDNKVVLP